MTDTKYKLRYLPLFYEDLEEKIFIWQAGYERLDIGTKTGIYIIIPLTFPILQAFPPVH